MSTTHDQEKLIDQAASFKVDEQLPQGATTASTTQSAEGLNTEDVGSSERGTDISQTTPATSTTQPSIAGSGTEKLNPIEKPSHRGRNAVAVGTAVLAAAGLFVLGKATSGGSHNSTAAPVAERTVNPTPTPTNNQAPTESPSPTSIPSVAEVNPSNSAPIIGEGETSSTKDASSVELTPGNIDLADPLFTPTADTDDTIDSVWGNDQIELSKLLSPAQYSPTKVAESVLNLMANAISCEQGSGSQVLSYLSNQSSVQEDIASYNQSFQAAAKNGPYTEQLEFYDTASDPATFQEDGVDIDGNPIIDMASGTLYAQRITGGDWQSPEGRDLSKAVKITDMQFSYKPSANGYTISVQSIRMGLDFVPYLSQQ